VIFILKNVDELLAQLGWKAETVEEIKGGYAGTLYRLQVVADDGKRSRLVYKRLAPDRTAELGLYRDLLCEVPHGIPKLYGTVEEADEQGLLLEDAGRVLKPAFQRESVDGKRAILQTVVGVLAELHVAMERQSQEWLASGKAAAYPFESSVEWGEQAVEQLEWLAEQGLFGVNRRVVEEVRGIAEAFYPRYPEWTQGSTTFTHGDPHMENVLLDEGQIRLIDWEWACVSLPQRDLSILLQDVLERDLHHVAWDVYLQELHQRGWQVAGEEVVKFAQGFRACLLDNTLMMLGWEIGKYRNGYVSAAEMQEILDAKVAWLSECWERLRGTD
jgi:thiamine kinase-like enzyme